MGIVDSVDIVHATTVNGRDPFTLQSVELNTSAFVGARNNRFALIRHHNVGVVGRIIVIRHRLGFSKGGNRLYAISHTDSRLA